MVIDPVTESRLKLVYPGLSIPWQEIRKAFWNAYELQLRVTRGYSSFEDQWKIYAKGRKKNQRGEWIVFDPKKVVTNARGGESFHNFGLAIDVAFMGDDPYLEKLPPKEFDFYWGEYGKLCKQFELEWGGDWKRMKDRPHCQKDYGLTLAELQMLYEEAGLKGVFARCNQILTCGTEAEL
jgi:hypothetical protein